MILLTVKIWMHEMYPSNTICSYPAAHEAYESMKKQSGDKVLNTTCTELCDSRVLKDANRLVVVYPNHEAELALGRPCVSGRYIRSKLNLRNLLVAGEFASLEDEGGSNECQ